MNLQTFIITVLILALLLWGFFKLRTMAKQDDYKEAAVILRGGSLVVAVLFLLGVVTLAGSSGFVNLADPFQGQKVGNKLPTTSAPVEVVAEPPKLKGVAIQPDFDAAKREHQEQLKSFENKQP